MDLYNNLPIDILEKIGRFVFRIRINNEIMIRFKERYPTHMIESFLDNNSIQVTHPGRLLLKASQQFNYPFYKDKNIIYREPLSDPCIFSQKYYIAGIELKHYRDPWYHDIHLLNTAEFKDCREICLNNKWIEKDDTSLDKDNITQFMIKMEGNKLKY